MNARERFRQICQFERPNDPFVWGVAAWNEALERWVGEGMPARDVDERGRPRHVREVNALLREAHEDVATLRRELVDYGYLSRAQGVYRVATALPRRSAQLRQEMTGDEQAWLERLLGDAARRAIAAGRS